MHSILGIHTSFLELGFRNVVVLDFHTLRGLNYFRFLSFRSLIVISDVIINFLDIDLVFVVFGLLSIIFSHLLRVLTLLLSMVESAYL